MVRGPRVLVAEQHGHLKHVPGELQCQVRAYEDVAARYLDRGQNRVEPEVADQLGYRIRRWLALAPLSSGPGPARLGGVGGGHARGGRRLARRELPAAWGPALPAVPSGGTLMLAAPQPTVARTA
jgi:hypothetical protein